LSRISDVLGLGLMVMSFDRPTTPREGLHKPLSGY